MNKDSIPFEVEIRFHFDSFEDACNRIPFLRDSLDYENKKTWDSRIYGQELFKSGRLLRIGVLSPVTDPKYFLCLKGPDIGRFANIRQEIDEEIIGRTANTTILEQLGARTDITTVDEIQAELTRLGHHEFMSFGGEDTYGCYEQYGIDIKLMSCPVLKYPLMVEFEKIAATEAEAFAYDNDLKKITEELKLGDVLVRDEPPTLLYQVLFE
ncbi:MAG: hypothetical protein JW712_03535 [Dehalococcoidales bacterium]|nr:hypothetical protein [Dehalococcoidales bacterium]